MRGPLKLGRSMDAPGLVPSLIGAPLATRCGGVTAIVEDVPVDAASHRPVWLLVRLCHAATPYTYVPAERLASRGRAVVVPFDEDVVRNAPVRLAAPVPCGREHAAALCRHYGVRAPFGDPRCVRGAPAVVAAGAGLSRSAAA